MIFPLDVAPRRADTVGVTREWTRGETKGPAMNTPDRFLGLAVRPLTEDERFFLTHVSMFGSTPDTMGVRKVASRWTWDVRSCHATKVYATKREAAANAEQFHR